MVFSDGGVLSILFCVCVGEWVGGNVMLFVVCF